MTIMNDTVKKTKTQRQREVAIKLMKDHLDSTGLNLYFRNSIYHVLKEDIEHTVKTMVDDGTVTKVMVKGAVAYKLNDPTKD